VTVSHNDPELERITNKAKQRGENIFIEDVNLRLSSSVARLLKSFNSGKLTVEKRSLIILRDFHHFLEPADHDLANKIFFFSTIENCKEVVELTTKLNFVQFSCQLEGFTVNFFLNVYNNCRITQDLKTTCLVHSWLKITQ
jgi:hypothetical protein